jgi:D-aminopeptidase
VTAKPRARDLGIPFDGTAGTNNAVTDVAGVQVGYRTLIEGSGQLRVGDGPVRTGVSAILPRGRHGVGEACAAGFYSLNGNGEMTGTVWIEESGSLSSPVLITNTHAVGACHRGIIDWTVEHKPNEVSQWLLPVVAETWDGYLNDINGSHVQPHHAGEAIEAAGDGPISEGSVGGGTGMNCYAFKGGSGTASRVVPFGDRSYTVGVFIQANFGSRDELTIAGIRAGRILREDNPLEDSDWLAPPGAGSSIVVVATDAPLLPTQCKSLARRVPLGLARTGTTGSHFSGDIFLAFSTANRGVLDSILAPRPVRGRLENLSFVPWVNMDPLFEATVQSVEEAVLNALVAAETMVGRDDHRSPALPHDSVRDLMARRSP